MKIIGKIIRYFSSFFLPMIFIEKIYINKKITQNIPPLFIIGPPRSGTTLIYQLLSSSLNLGYISNIASVFYKFPVIITLLLKNKIKKYNPGHLDSNYGFVNGLYSPSESSQVFEHWFKNKERVIKNSIYKMSEILSKPIITKYLKNHLKLDYLYNIFPTALFIIVKRDILYNSQSIIYGYQYENKKIKALPSSEMINKGYSKMELIVEDIMLINKNINTFINENNPQYIIVDYDKIDKNYKNIVQLVKDYYHKFDILLDDFQLEKYKEHIKISENKKLKDSEWERLKLIIEKSNNKPA